MSPKTPEEQPPSRVDNQVSGDVTGHVIQAGSIRDVVIHTHPESPHAPAETPLLVTAEPVNVRSAGLIIPAGGPDGEDEHLIAAAGVRALVEAFSAQAVILHRMRPVILSATPPRPCLYLNYAGLLDERRFSVDLDAERPVLRPQPDPYAPRGADSPLADFPFTVTNSDPELFIISPASRYEVLWRLELGWTSAGRSGTVVIDDGGSPFHYHPGTPEHPSAGRTISGPY
ncbi:hypothetical protein ACWCP6_24050 [Streptomyces sp. NPDC002004]